MKQVASELRASPSQNEASGSFALRFLEMKQVASELRASLTENEASGFGVSRLVS